MSSREKTAPSSSSKLSEKDELFGALDESDSALIEHDLHVDEMAQEICTNIQVNSLRGTVRNADVATVPEIKIVTVSENQTSKEIEEIIPNITDEGVLQDQETGIAGASYLRKSRNRKIKAKHAQKKSENGEHGVPNDFHDESVLEASEREDSTILMLREKSDHSYTNKLLLYSNTIAKLMNIDKGLDYVLDRFNEHKNVDLLLESLHIFDKQIHYNEELPCDRFSMYHSTIEESAACAGSSQEAIQSNVSAIDHETICGRYISIFKRINERVIGYTTMFKDLNICLNIFKTNNVSIGNARLQALVWNVDSYRRDCFARVKNILFILKLFEKNVERRIQDCYEVTFNLLEIAKASSNDAEKNETLNLYSSCREVIKKLLTKEKEYMENGTHMTQKNKDIFKQSNSLEFWGPDSNPMYKKDPKFIMTKTNALILLSFEVFDSLLKIIADVQCIITLANSIAR